MQKLFKMSGKYIFRFVDLKIWLRLTIGYVVIFIFFAVIALAAVRTIKTNNERALIQSELNSAVAELWDGTRVQEEFVIRGRKGQRDKISRTYSIVRNVAVQNNKATQNKYPSLNDAILYMDTIIGKKDYFFANRTQYDSILAVCLKKVQALKKIVESPIASGAPNVSVTSNKNSHQISAAINLLETRYLLFQRAPGKARDEEQHSNSLLYEINTLLSQNKPLYFVKTSAQRENMVAMVKDLIQTNSEFIELSKINNDFFAQIKNMIHPTIGSFRDAINNISNDNEADLQFVISLILYLVAVVLLVMSGLAYYITRSVTHGIDEIVRVAGAISRGGLGVNIQKSLLTRNDEIGVLSRSFEVMSNRLRTTISDVMDAASFLSSASSQLDSSSKQLSTSASQQASSVEEISSTVEELVANVEQNSVNSLKTQKMANAVFMAIKQVTVNTQSAVAKSEQITIRVKTISDIAMQTNILALNAAVEAARAGVAGRGFAVVAAEVRKLAEKSKDASVDINQLSIEGYEESLNGGESLNKILPDIEMTGELIDNISVASQEQNAGAMQINSALNSLNDLTQINAAQSEEIAASASELKVQAEKLNTAIAIFSLEDELVSEDLTAKDKITIRFFRRIFKPFRKK